MSVHRLSVPAVMLFLLMIQVPSGIAAQNISLDVAINVEQSRLNGTASMDVTSGEEVVLMTGGLIIDAVTLDGERLDHTLFEGTLTVLPRRSGDMQVRYHAVFRESGRVRGADNPTVDNVIDGRGVSLTNLWYPTHGELARYELTASFPAGYTAISEADSISHRSIKGREVYTFSFPYRIEGINLVASDRYVTIEEDFRDIRLFAYFFHEDRELAQTYLEYTKKYLEMYESLIDMYPYRRFSIVENFLPTGYSMPTYTLLGSMVVKLPFIVRTSLGHEILHQWFGSSVYTDYGSGNWAEGLTAYLADHLYREQEGMGRHYRKQVLIDYRSYVSLEKDIPLKYFTGRVDRASRAIGYGKSAMVFHMLYNEVGKNTFYSALREFFRDNLFRNASWNDLKSAFEKRSGKDLGWFFTQWLEKEGLVELTLYGAEMRQSGNRVKLHFHVEQDGSDFRVKVPVTFYFRDSVLFDTLAIEGKDNSFDFNLPAKPHTIVLDEDYDIARGIGRNEYPPVVARLLEEDQMVIVPPERGREIYQGVIDAWERRGAVTRLLSDIKLADMEGSSLIILGRDNQLISRLFGSVDQVEAGFSFVVKNNPWSDDKVVGIVHGDSKDEVDAAVRKVSHYGKYSRLLFNEGVNIKKETEKSDRGIIMHFDHEATAIAVSSIQTIGDVIEGVRDRRIVYVGEVHDVFAHHAVQMDIITAVHSRYPHMAIGMEMFQRPFQSTLDSYIEGRMTEEEFLRKSEYFKRWGFDYSLYRPILDFAKSEKVKVIALNLKKELIEKVSQGGIDSLSQEEKAAIPSSLDFSDGEYRERLQKIFKMHRNAAEKDFNNFYQAQILWDETMSQSVADHVSSSPDARMVVLAGQGHLRFGSGIPMRTFRRNGIDYATVLIDDEVEPGIADYVVFPKPVEGITTPKLMVFLKIDEGKIEIAGFPEESVSEKAGARKRDVIISLDGVTVSSVEDVKIFLLGKEKGEQVKVRVKRVEDEREQTVELDVTL